MNYELATQYGLIVFLHVDDADITDARRSCIVETLHATSLPQSRLRSS
jgi:hypothetical protein